MTNEDEYGEPTITKQLIPYDALHLYAAYLYPSVYFEWKMDSAIRKKWSPLVYRLRAEREKRIQDAIIAAVGQRRWEWFESTLHDDCE